MFKITRMKHLKKKRLSYADLILIYICYSSGEMCAQVKVYS